MSTLLAILAGMGAVCLAAIKEKRKRPPPTGLVRADTPDPGVDKAKMTYKKNRVK
jgi:hypothetical protein